MRASPVKGAEQKACVACGGMFQPYRRRCVRCTQCATTFKTMASGEAPLCACGCGEKTLAVANDNKWSTFRRGHHTRVRWATLGKAAYDRSKPAYNLGRKTRYAHKCKACGIDFLSKFKERDYCKRACMTVHYRAEKHTAWRGGGTKYKTLDMGDHTRREHLVFMEQWLGRALDRTEVVHHIDKNGMNNELSNLYLFHCQLCHRHHHAYATPLAYRYEAAHPPGSKAPAYRTGPRKIAPERPCVICGVLFRDKRMASKYCSTTCAGIGHRTHGEYAARPELRYQIVIRNGVKHMAHRLVMAASIGRELLPTEIVHHKDEIRKNNALENLFLFHCYACHNHHHNHGVPMAYKYELSEHWSVVSKKRVNV